MRFREGIFAIVFALPPSFNALLTTNDGSYRLDLNTIVFPDDEAWVQVGNDLQLHFCVHLF